MLKNDGRPGTRIAADEEKKSVQRNNEEKAAAGLPSVLPYEGIGVRNKRHSAVKANGLIGKTDIRQEKRGDSFSPENAVIAASGVYGK